MAQPWEYSTTGRQPRIPVPRSRAEALAESPLTSALRSPRRTHKLPEMPALPDPEKPLDRLLSSKTFRGATPEAQVGVLKQEFPDHFGNREAGEISAFLKDHYGPATEIGGEIVPHMVQDDPSSRDPNKGLTGAINQAGRFLRGAQDVLIDQPLAGATSRVGGNIIGATGLLGEVTRQEPTPSPTPEEYENRIPKMGGARPPGREMNPLVQAEIDRMAGGPIEDDPNARYPSAKQRLQQATYPLRAGLSAVGRATGLADPETPQGRAAVTALEGIKGYGEDVEALAAQVPPTHTGNVFMDLWGSVARGAGGAAVDITALRYMGKGLARTKIPGAPLAVLPIHGYAEARGRGTDEFAAALSGMFLQGGLSGASRLPSKALALLAGSALFGAEPLKLAAKGELPWHDAWAQVIIGGYFGAHGQHNHARRKQFLKAIEQLDGIEQAENMAAAIDAFAPRTGRPEEAPRGRPSPVLDARPGELIQAEEAEAAAGLGARERSEVAQQREHERQLRVEKAERRGVFARMRGEAGESPERADLDPAQAQLPATVEAGRRVGPLSRTEADRADIAWERGLDEHLAESAARHNSMAAERAKLERGDRVSAPGIPDGELTHVESRGTGDAYGHFGNVEYFDPQLRTVRARYVPLDQVTRVGAGKPGWLARETGWDVRTGETPEAVSRRRREGPPKKRPAPKPPEVPVEPPKQGILAAALGPQDVETKQPTEAALTDVPVESRFPRVAARDRMIEEVAAIVEADPNDPRLRDYPQELVTEAERRVSLVYEDEAQVGQTPRDPLAPPARTVPEPMPKIPPGAEKPTELAISEAPGQESRAEENKLVWGYKPVDPKTMPEEYRADVVPDVYEAETGKPFAATMYRGSGREDKGAVYAEGAEGAIAGEGAYWSPYERRAKRFGPNVESRVVELRNPLVIESNEQLAKFLGEPLARDRETIGPQAKRLREKAEAAGHDGLVVNVPMWSDVGRPGGSAKILKEWFGETQVLEFKPKAEEPTRLEVLAEDLVKGRGTISAIMDELADEAGVPRPAKAKPDPHLVDLAERMSEVYRGDRKRNSQGEMRELRDAGLATEHEDHTFTLTDAGRALLPRPEAKPEPEKDYGPPEVSARNEKGETTDEFLGERLRPNAVVADRAEAETDLTLADGTKVRVIPVMVELDSVQPSHKRQGQDMRPNPDYPGDELQTREYAKSKTAAKDVVRWGTSDWNEDLIYKPSPTNATGPMVVHPKFGATLGGTSRWNILNERERQHPGSLGELAARHEEGWGFAPGTSKYFTKPAIVLAQITGLPQSKAGARKLSDLMNVPTTRELTTAEKAVGMAAKMGDKTIDALDAAVESAPDGATLNQILERSPKLVDAMIAEGVIPESRRDALYNAKTQRLTPQGRREIEDAIIARVIPRPDLTQRVSDDLRARLSLLSPAIMRAQKDAPGFLDRLLVDAIESEIHRAGMATPQKIEDYLGERELDLGDSGMSPSKSDPRVAAIHRILAPSQAGGVSRTTAKKRLAAFSKRLEDSRLGLDDMFGEQIAGDPGTAFEKTFMSGDMRQEPRVEEKVVSDEGARQETRPSSVSVGDEVEIEAGTYKHPRKVTGKVEELLPNGRARVVYPNKRGDKQLSKSVSLTGPKISKMTTPKVSKMAREDMEAEEPLGPGENYRAPGDMRVVEPDAPVPKGMPRRIRRGDVLYKILKGYRWSMNFGRMRAKYAKFGEEDRGFQQSPQGWMKVKKWWDLHGGLHEIGHQMLDQWPVLRKTFAPESLTREAVEKGELPDYLREQAEMSPERGEPIEGFAEGIRLYNVEPHYLAERSPMWKARMDEFFNNLPPKEQELWRDLQRDTYTWFHQGARTGFWMTQMGENAHVWGAASDALDLSRARVVDGFAGAAALEMATTGKLSDTGPNFLLRMSRGISWANRMLTGKGYPVWDSTRGEIGYEGEGIVPILNTRVKLENGKWQYASPNQYELENSLHYATARQLDELSKPGRVVIIRTRRLVNKEDVLEFGGDKDDPRGRPQHQTEVRKVLVQKGRSPQEQVEDVLYRDYAEESNMEGGHLVEDAVWITPDAKTKFQKLDRRKAETLPEFQIAYDTFAYDRPTGKLLSGAKAADAKGIDPNMPPEFIEAGLRYENPARLKMYEKIVDFHDNVAQFAQDLGLLSREARDMWPWMSYAMGAFRVMEGPDAGASRSWRGRLGTQAPIKKYTGSSRNMKDPLTRLYEGPSRLITHAIQNMMRQEIYRHLMMKGGGSFGGEIKPESDVFQVKVADVRRAAMQEMKKEADAAGIDVPEDFMKHELLPDYVTLFRGRREAKDPTTMTVFFDGKPRYAEIHDPILQDALAHMHTSQSGWVMRAFNSMRKTLQSSVTLHPDFWVGQMARDPITNWVYSRADKKFLRTIFKGYAHAIRYAVTGSDPLVEKATANLGGGGLIREQGLQATRGLWTVDEGGSLRDTTLGVALDKIGRSKRTAERLDFWRRKREVIKAGKWQHGNVAEKMTTMNNPLDIVRFLERVTMATEMGPRLGEMIRAEAAGKTGLALGKYYREASVDFAQRGQGGTTEFATRIVPFLGAQIASWDRAYRAFGPGMLIGKEKAAKHRFLMDPTMKARAAMKAATLIATSMALTAYNRQWDEYNGLTPREKMLYYHFFVPYGVNADGSYKLYPGRMPRPYDVGMFSAIGDMFLTNLLEDEDPEPFSHGMALLWLLEMNFGIGLPPIGDAVLKWWANKESFTGAPVESQATSRRSGWMRHRVDTSEAMKRIAESSRKWPVQVRPALVESMMKSFWGNWPSWVLGGLDDIFFPGKPTKRWGERMGFRRMISEPDIRNRWSGDFYEFRKRANEAVANRKGFKEEGRQDLMDEQRGTIDYVMKKAAPRLNDLAEQISKKRGKIDAISNPRIKHYKTVKGKQVELTPDEKRDVRTKLLKERSVLYKKGVDYAKRKRREWRAEQAGAR